MPDNQNHIGAVPGGIQPTPGQVPPAMSAHLKSELDGLLKSNQAGFAELDRMGVRIDPAELLNIRIWTLAQLVLSEPGLLQFQLRFERQVAEAIENIKGEARKARLAAPPQAIQQINNQINGRLLGPNGQPLR